MGHLTLIMGCMFAQKTTELLRQIRRFESIGYKVLVVNYAADTRYGRDCIASHDVDKHPATCISRLSELNEKVAIGNYDVIIIDEGQFFQDLFDEVTRMADTLPLHIIVCGLDGDSERRPFGDMLRLIPHAEKVERLTAYCAECRDGTVAHFSKRFVGKGTGIAAGGAEGQVAVGAGDMYRPVCRRHFLEKK
jgi:thymidine kinase